MHFLRPTVIQRLRAFSHDVSAPAPAWATADEVLDHVWQTMAARRDDAHFWEHLERLVESVASDMKKDSTDGLPTPEAELLSPEKIAGLVADLRAEMQRPAAATEHGSQWPKATVLSAPVAAFVLLMGTAVAAGSGCDDDRGQGGPGAAAGTAPMQAATPAEAPQQVRPVPAAEPPVPPTQPSSVDPAHEDLTNLFRNNSPEVIAQELEKRVGVEPDPPSEAAPQGAQGTLAAPNEAGSNAVAPAPPRRRVRRPPPEGWNVPPYKGVTL